MKNMVLKNLTGFGLTNLDYEWLQKSKNDKQKLISAAMALKLLDPHRKIEDLEKMSRKTLSTAIGNYLETFRDNPWQTINMMQSQGFNFKLKPEFFENHHVDPQKGKKTSRKENFSNEEENEDDNDFDDQRGNVSLAKRKNGTGSAPTNKTVLKTASELESENFEKEMRLLDEREISAMKCPSCRVIREEYFSFDMKRLLDEPSLLLSSNWFDPEDTNKLVEAMNNFTNALQSNGRKETLDARNIVVTSTNSMNDSQIQKFGNILNLLTDRALSFYDTDPSKAIELMKTRIEKRHENFNVLKDEFSNHSGADVIDPLHLETVAKSAGLPFVAERFKSLSSSDALNILNKSENNLKVDHVMRSSRTQFREDLNSDPRQLSHAARTLLLPDPTQKENEKVFHVGCMIREIPGIVGDYFKAMMSLE